MRTMVKSMKRLYDAGKVTKEQIKEIKISFSSLQRLAFKPFILLLTLKYYFNCQKLNIASLFFIVFLLKLH